MKLSILITSMMLSMASIISTANTIDQNKNYYDNLYKKIELNFDSLSVTYMVNNLSKFKKIEKNRFDQKEHHCLALNIYHESRDQGEIGMLWVGHVVMNRVESPIFPNSVCEVTYQRKQFSWVIQKSDHTPYEKESWELSQKLAFKIIDRTWDRSKGSLYYYNPSLASPSWASKMKKVDHIGDHVFLTSQK